MTYSCGLLPVLNQDADEQHYEMSDYEGAGARWCPGCGDHSVLTAVQRLLSAEQMIPDQTMFVSGIGCSSRFPHYLRTYGFHGIHGRALPVATGIKLHRPELNVFVVMGDGDCTSIGAGHWLHALRYNMDLTVLMLDNGIYGLTKMQTSPTTPAGFKSNTQPRGGYLPPLNPIEVALGVTNASFVAQTAEWVPSHLYATLRAAWQHKGFSFVRILQRCPVFTPLIYQQAIQDPARIALLVHDDGVVTPELDKIYGTRVHHDLHDLAAARAIAEQTDHIHLGVFFRDPSKPRYEETRRVAPHTPAERVQLLEQEFARYAV